MKYPVTIGKIIMALLPAAYFISTSCNSNNESDHTVLKGPFMQSVIETGELQAVNSSTLTMPKINSIFGYNFKIVGLAEHGKNVRKGDPVIYVDPAAVQKYIIERRESLENELASASKLKVQNSNNMQDLRAQFRNEEASFNIKKLELGKSAFESAGIRKVIELEYRQSEIRLNKLKRKLGLKPRLDSLDYRIQQIKVTQKQNELDAALESLNQLTVCSPLDGIFVLENNMRTNQLTKVGDELYMSSVVARIPDIRTMKVNGIVRENDISKIRTGQEVIVRLDALPSIPFHARVNKVGRICIQQEGKKVFQTELLISESDPRLKPGMTVSCEYIVYRDEDETYVPVNCILEEHGHYYVFTGKKDRIRKTEVETGPSNNLYTVVRGDLKPGQGLIPPENILNKQKL